MNDITDNFLMAELLTPKKDLLIQEALKVKHPRVSDLLAADLDSLGSFKQLKPAQQKMIAKEKHKLTILKGKIKGINRTLTFNQATQLFEKCVLNVLDKTQKDVFYIFKQIMVNKSIDTECFCTKSFFSKRIKKLVSTLRWNEEAIFLVNWFYENELRDKKAWTESGIKHGFMFDVLRKM